MLRLARADAGIRRLHLEPLVLADNLRQACEQLAGIAANRGLALGLTASEEAPRDGDVVVLAEAMHLRRLWLILLENAIKYTPSGGRIDVDPVATYKG
jgi:signal transduction histidine kinase